METSLRTAAHGAWRTARHGMASSCVLRLFPILSADVKRCGLTVKARGGGARHGASPG